MQSVERIANGDEDGFANMKRYINREIKGWFHRERGRQRVRGGSGHDGDGDEGAKAPKLVVDIDIERMGEDNDGREWEVGSMGEEDVELEW